MVLGGKFDGEAEGDNVGRIDGIVVGFWYDGATVGDGDGIKDGIDVGAEVGTVVGP